MMAAACMNLHCANKQKNRVSRPRESEIEREKILATIGSSMEKFDHCRLRISRAKFLRAFSYNVSDEVCERLGVFDFAVYHLYETIII